MSATDKRQMAAYAEAERMLGLTEKPGAEHNAEIIKFFAESGHSWVKDDETAWCAAMMGAVLKRSGLKGTGKLNARSYLDWGLEVEPSSARKGDVVIFWRGEPNSWKGHVGFYSGETSTHIIVLGGNQGNAISKAKYPKSRLLGVRRLPATDIAQPEPIKASPLSWLLQLLKGFKR
jgi:uncharacterized protein (TIGR02594 family)